MSTLVLRPAALYAAYLAGRRDAYRDDAVDVCAIDSDDGPPPGTIERMTAYDLGQVDRRGAPRVQEPATVADVVRRVQEALGEPVRITEERAIAAARDALGVLGGAPEDVVRKLAASILAAVNCEAPALAVAARPAP
jgi:hypothetical protein